MHCFSKLSETFSNGNEKCAPSVKGFHVICPLFAEIGGGKTHVRGQRLSVGFNGARHDVAWRQLGSVGSKATMVYTLE